MAKLRIAVQGCCHGELNNIFKQVTELHKKNPIDLLVILGDFQSIRSGADFQSISIPPKYQKLGDFQYYYNEQVEQQNMTPPPVPTLFIGGNHESMRHLMLLPYGGYAAENIYYLGYSNVIWFKGVRIGSLSGIWKHWDINKERPAWENMEKDHCWSRSVRELYHVRKWDLIPLYMLSGNRQSNRIDIMLSHDWPNEIVYHGDYKDLIRVKPFFKRDIDNRELGSPVNWELLRNIKPTWWLSAHLHVRYKAFMKHTKRKLAPLEKKNTDEIDLDFSSEEEAEFVPEQTTTFLALDKCLPRRRHLEVIEVEADTNHPSFTGDGANSMYWDPELIANVQYMEQHRKELQKIPFQGLDWAQLVSNSNQLNGKITPIDWSHYRIPQYQAGVQRQETQQTDYFKHQFLSEH